MEDHKEIALFIPSLQGGGAERFMVDLSNGFAKKGYNVSLIVGNMGGEYFSEINNAVKVIDLKCKRTIFCIPGIVSFLRKNKPHTLISTIYHANMVAILSSLISFTNTRIFVRDSNMHKTLKEASSSFFSYKLTFFFMKVLYRRCSGIVAVSQAMRDELKYFMPEIEHKLHLIHNFIDLDQINSLAQEEVDHPWLNEDSTSPVILSAGRLSNQKNWPLLLKAFSEVVKTKFVRLIILGEGKQRKEIEELLVELDIKDKVSMPGFKKNPFSWMARAEIFVLSSDAEGFPNVLVQALNCGCKVVSSDCESGPREILEDGKWGRLCKVGDARDLSNQIKDALEQEENINTRKRAMHFSNERCIEEYRKLFFERNQTT